MNKGLVPRRVGRVSLALETDGKGDLLREASRKVKKTHLEKYTDQPYLKLLSRILFKNLRLVRA